MKSHVFPSPSFIVRLYVKLQSTTFVSHPTLQLQRTRRRYWRLTLAWFLASSSPPGTIGRGIEAESGSGVGSFWRVPTPLRRRMGPALVSHLILTIHLLRTACTTDWHFFKITNGLPAVEPNCLRMRCGCQARGTVLPVHTRYLPFPKYAINPV